MSFQDILIDKQLNIDTEHRSEKYSNDESFPYEPTPYSVLQRLMDNEIIHDKSHVIDFGSGMGRACIFFAQKTGCRCTGIEAVDEFYEAANNNISDDNVLVRFVHSTVENYVIDDDADIMYFFNPFSETVLAKVMKNIVDSYYRNPRYIQLLFYYPSDEYISLLSRMSEISFYDEIDCMDLFDEETNRNRVMIWTMGEVYMTV